MIENKTILKIVFLTNIPTDIAFDMLALLTHFIIIYINLQETLILLWITKQI